jgi:hypothetical protein
MKQNELDLDNWLEEVADKCHEIASQKDFDLDFYVFQSEVHYNPKLMFIGANPGGVGLYSQRQRRTKSELGENINTFVKYYNSPGWEKLNPLYDMFKGNDQIELYFKEAVITNISYFNSGTFNGLKNKMKIVGKEPLNFCMQKNLELIKTLIYPQNIILMGAPARDNFLKYLCKPLEIILETKSIGEKNGVPLIKKSFFPTDTKDFQIPVYIIEHPSAWNGLNNKENVERKRKKFEEIFARTIE